MSTRKGCAARQYSDQMQCARCGLAWDKNDSAPPDCLSRTEANRVKGRATLDRILADLAPPSYIIDREVN